MYFTALVHMQVGGSPCTVALSVEQCNYVMWTEVGHGLCDSLHLLLSHFLL